ncbi:hypothetical protein FOQG_01488 [Fusarium oxysporum f. sp. raphani 54005]|uniref:Uncharacterized protein n=8 Tax=Fusarium oxysporum species complex TaxID=171631 RepID=X0D4Y5_FUSOX|nr:hypothetical protein FOXG_03322 [Fusarium oxysporum f. sp. lycopersici 4287]XP_031071668.1 uncharacterized protein FOIG_02341 [Fusarium odoratissimum NRRL 54006]EXA40520.1 hypothetical protein FOVG_09334 [Fusarium oxysporum f. sp. pisi HDV247]EXK30896.1 hypothetical protein FOMG_12736 [Fusarium oxysporum f. sp. melonis 26406]EXK98638.1 hypothetical protein FOQG_01488 [Fusarium oxysporum f. sp. raphani 54005]EXL88635.1 hypothetical protein FOPG_00876 [Fusarium oxysporum f. sp. conglutinans r
MSSLFGKSGGGSRFQLPALNLNFGSITDGTNIPPPPESPVQKVPTPPQTPPPAKDVKDESKKEPGQDTYSSVTEDVNKNTPQPSITASSNEGQISSNGSVPAAGAGGLARPSSQGGASYLDERKSRRTSGWFRRMRTGETIPNKRASTMFMEEGPRAPTPKKQSGPPPPMIPELTDLEKDNGSLGSDLFKNIK